MGACWYHRPLRVEDGFETEFTFRIEPPQPDGNGAKRTKVATGNGRFTTYADADDFGGDLAGDGGWFAGLTAGDSSVASSAARVADKAKEKVRGSDGKYQGE